MEFNKRSLTTLARSWANVIGAEAPLQCDPENVPEIENLVKENAEPDLASMGLDIISFNVQNFVDGNGVIENLGVDNIVKIQKNAAISRAESEKEIAKAQANAKKEENEAQVNADTEIAIKENE